MKRISTIAVSSLVLVSAVFALQVQGSGETSRGFTPGNAAWSGGASGTNEAGNGTVQFTLAAEVKKDGKTLTEYTKCKFHVFKNEEARVVAHRMAEAWNNQNAASKCVAYVEPTGLGSGTLHTVRFYPADGGCPSGVEQIYLDGSTTPVPPPGNGKYSIKGLEFEIKRD